MVLIACWRLHGSISPTPPPPNNIGKERDTMIAITTISVLLYYIFEKW